MKVWLSGLVVMFLACSVQAEDYRAVYSPRQALEVYIDNVQSNAPEDWCKTTLPLRIVTEKEQSVSVLNAFLPQVGRLLANQCSKLTNLPWHMTNQQGTLLASGSASKAQEWAPVVTADSTAHPGASNAAPLDLSPMADTTPLVRFDLPSGCHFRTWWSGSDSALFIPDAAQNRCTPEGWLQGDTTLSLTDAAQNVPLTVTFEQGYPLENLRSATTPLQVVSANNQRIIVTRSDAQQSWLVLPFDHQHHVWRFDGTLLIKAAKPTAQQTDSALQQRIAEQLKLWSENGGPQQKMHVLLIDTLHADLVDPAIGAWRNID